MLAMEYRIMAMSFAEVVKFHRARLGLTQQALADKMGRSYTRIQKAEQGQALRRLPPAEEFKAWANALEVPPEVMLAQMGYINQEAADRDRPRQPELLFASLAEEIMASETMPAEVQESALDGLKQARRIYDLIKQRNGNTTS